MLSGAKEVPATTLEVVLALANTLATTLNPTRGREGRGFGARLHTQATNNVDGGNVMPVLNIADKFCRLCRC